MTNKTALVLGATGLVGKQLVKQLLLDERYSKVIVFLRRPLPQTAFFDPQNKLYPLVIDYEQMAEYEGYFKAEHIYVCLGTTLKQAKNKAAFRKVDFDYVHVAAQLARAQQSQSFVWISSVGANAKSTSFYLRVKGELENAIFALSGLNNPSAVRPSLLLGERSEKRCGEQLAITLSPVWSLFCVGTLAKYKPVKALDVASKMIAQQQF